MPKRKSRLGWKNAALANGQSITNCATGYSRANDTGASPFQLFGKTGSIVHCRKKNCQSSRRRSKITNRPAPAEPPLAKAKEWIRYSDKAMRETNTMPQWAGSCWYYLRFCDPHNDKRFVGEEAERYWMGGDKPGGVDLYVGGTEHAVLHLLYARFWQKVLFDLGYVSKPEPFQRLVNQGIILGEDNQKMSKSRGNIVNPDDVIDQHGADAFRCYEMFMGPLEQMKPWSTRGVEGVARFLARVWRLLMTENQAGEWELSKKIKAVDATKPQQKLLHATIKKVTEDIESFSFNTAISQMMIFVNAFTNVETIPVVGDADVPDPTQSIRSAHFVRAVGEIER